MHEQMHVMGIIHLLIGIVNGHALRIAGMICPPCCNMLYTNIISGRSAINAYNTLSIAVFTFVLSVLAIGNAFLGKNANAKAIIGVVGHMNAPAKPHKTNAHFFSAKK